MELGPYSEVWRRYHRVQNALAVAFLTILVGEVGATFTRLRPPKTVALMIACASILIWTGALMWQQRSLRCPRCGQPFFRWGQTNSASTGEPPLLQPGGCAHCNLFLDAASDEDMAPAAAYARRLAVTKSRTAFGVRLCCIVAVCLAGGLFGIRLCNQLFSGNLVPDGLSVLTWLERASLALAIAAATWTTSAVYQRRAKLHDVVAGSRARMFMFAPYALKGIIVAPINVMTVDFLIYGHIQWLPNVDLTAVARATLAFIAFVIALGWTAHVAEEVELQAINSSTLEM